MHLKIIILFTQTNGNTNRCGVAKRICASYHNAALQKTLIDTYCTCLYIDQGENLLGSLKQQVPSCEDG